MVSIVANLFFVLVKYMEKNDETFYCAGIIKLHFPLRGLESYSIFVSSGFFLAAFAIDFKSP